MLLSLTAFAAAEVVTDLPVTVLVDSGETLANEPLKTEEDRVLKALGEWATNGNLDNWSPVAPTTATVASNILTLTENGAPAGISLTLPNQVDLDFGFNDFLWIRCRLPLGSTGDLKFSFATTFEPAFSPEKSFIIPATTLVADGQYHEYVIDLGLVRRWRSHLTMLKIEPFSGTAPAGRAIHIDYLRVGDLTSDVLAVNTNLNFFQGEDLTSCSKVYSKHFALWWSPEAQRFLTQIAPTYPPFATDYERQRNCLRMFEETYQYYCKVLGYREPFFHNAGTVPGKFKLNATTWWQGGFGSEHLGFPTVNVHATSMTDDRASNPNNHEFGHAIQTTGPGFFGGNHWESHVGSMHVGFMYYWGEVTDARLNLAPLSWINYVDKTVYKSSLMFEWPGFVYADRRPYLYLNEDLDNFGLTHNLTALMWNTPPKNQYFPDALRKQVGATLMKDLALGWSRRIPFFDNPSGELEREWFSNVFQTTARETAMKRQRVGMILSACPDKPNTWHSTTGTGPMNLGYSHYELVRPAGGSLTARVDKLDVAGTTEDLRWCLAAVSFPSNAVRYSGFSKPGESVTFNLTAAETSVFLVVAGTPDTLDYNLLLRENILNLDKSPGRMRYPFEVLLTGTTPKPKQIEMPVVAGQAHSNGGGFVASTATVHPTAYVGPNARVLGSAKIYNTARIDGQATVVDATIRDSARVTGSAVVYGSSVNVSGNARIRDRAMAHAGIVISGNALLSDHATMSAGTLSGDATARGLSESYSNSPYLSQVGGHAILDGDYVMPWNAVDGVHKTHIPWGEFYWDYYAKWLKKPEGLIARYRVEEPDGGFLWDTFGSLHAILRGTAQRTFDSTMGDNVLVLTGSQHLLLDPSIGDSPAFSFAGWMKLDAANPLGAPLLFLGHKSTEFISLVPNTSTNRPELTVQRAGSTIKATGPAAIAAGIWHHLGITLDGVTAKLFVNGTEVASVACDYRPYEVITPDIQTLGQANYLGRGWSGSFLRASIDDLRFYNIAITPAAMARARDEKGRTLAVLYDQSPLVLTSSDTTIHDTGIVSPDECTLFAEINPTMVDDVSLYRPILDSNSNQRQVSGGYSPGIGIDNGKFVVYLNGMSRWDTGVTCTANVWQSVALTYGSDGTRLFLNGAEVAFRGGQQAFPREVTFQVGGSRLTTASRFAGSIRNVKILDRAMARNEVLQAMGSNTHRISVVSSYGGSVSPAAEVLVPNGESRTFTITPAAGFVSHALLVDGVSIPVATSYTFSNVTAARSIEAQFRKSGAYAVGIPAPENLLFAFLSGSLPASGPTGEWLAWHPVSAALQPVNSPNAVTENGRRWVNNRYAAANSYQLGRYTAPIPCNGATIIAAVKPVRNGISSAYNVIVATFTDNLMLGIRNDTGALTVSRKGTMLNSNVIIPDGQITILSLVVQPTGAYKVFANGIEVISVTATSAFTSLTPGTSANTSTITVGANAADGWSPFNGLIGDLFCYKTAQSDADRILVENLITRGLTEPATLQVTPATQAVASTGGSVNLTLTGNQAWARTIVGGGSWLTTSAPPSGIGNASVAYQVAANPTSSPRTATISFTGGGITTTHTVTSEANSAPLTITGWRSLASHAGVARGLVADDLFVEPRSSGLRNVTVTFSRPIALVAGQTVATFSGSGPNGSLSLAGLGLQLVPSVSGNTLTLAFTAAGVPSGLPDASRWRINLNAAAVTATDGTPVQAGSAVVRLLTALRGDATGDGSVTGIDLNFINVVPGFDPAVANCLRADIDGDGAIGPADFAAAWANRNQTTATLTNP